MCDAERRTDDRKPVDTSASDFTVASQHERPRITKRLQAFASRPELSCKLCSDPDQYDNALTQPAYLIACRYFSVNRAATDGAPLSDVSTSTLVPAATLKLPLASK